MTGPLPDSSFLVLALVAESETHGYDLQRQVHDRGFRFWTKIQRSSIYNALAQLEAEGLISARVIPGKGPNRKVYKPTQQGLARLEREAARHLADPGHPRREIDLGIYALPFMSRSLAMRSFDDCLGQLRARREFLAERLRWCGDHELRLPALAFERPLLALDAEIAWLERVAREYAASGAADAEWARYVYREPPAADVAHAAPPRSRGGSRDKPSRTRSGALATRTGRGRAPRARSSRGRRRRTASARPTRAATSGVIVWSWSRADMPWHRTHVATRRSCATCRRRSRS